MKQKELAQALGLSEAAVSRLRKRGMPCDTPENAQAWRRRNVAPYARCPVAPPTPGPHREGGALVRNSPPRRDDPIDEIEGVIRGSVVLPRAVLPALIGAVDIAIQAHQQAGQDAAHLRGPLCELLCAMPDDERRLSMAAWSVATGLELPDNRAG